MECHPQLVFFLRLQIQVGPPPYNSSCCSPSLLTQQLLVDYLVCKHIQSTSAQHLTFEWVINGQALKDAVSEIRSLKKLGTQILYLQQMCFAVYSLYIQLQTAYKFFLIMSSVSEFSSCMPLFTTQITN